MQFWKPNRSIWWFFDVGNSWQAVMVCNSSPRQLSAYKTKNSLFKLHQNESGFMQFWKLIISRMFEFLSEFYEEENNEHLQKFSKKIDLETYEFKEMTKTRWTFIKVLIRIDLYWPKFPFQMEVLLDSKLLKTKNRYISDARK